MSPFFGHIDVEQPARYPDENFRMKVQVPQSCPTLCDPMVCSSPGSSAHGDSLGKNTAVGCHFLLQGIFPTQGSNPGLPHCRQILDCLSHQGNPWTHTIDIIPVISGIALLWALHMNVHCYMHVNVTSLAKCFLETGLMLFGHKESSQYIHIGKLTERQVFQSR